MVRNVPIIVGKKDDPRKTQRWNQVMIMEFKQVLNYIYFSLSHLYCHSFDQKTGAAF